MKNKYQINCIHETYEDNYERGEGRSVNSYVEKDVIHAENPMEALEKFYSKHMNHEFDATALEFDGEDVHDCIVVDSENLPASESDIEKWENGEITLYSDRITLKVYELVIVDFKKYQAENQAVTQHVGTQLELF